MQCNRQLSNEIVTLIQQREIKILFNFAPQMLKTIRPAQDEKKGWSDYRIGCSKELDLDILPHQVSLQTYSATLGHKVGQLEIEQFLCPNDRPPSLLSSC